MTSFFDIAWKYMYFYIKNPFVIYFLSPNPIISLSAIKYMGSLIVISVESEINMMSSNLTLIRWAYFYSYKLFLKISFGLKDIL